MRCGVRSSEGARETDVDGAGRPGDNLRTQAKLESIIGDLAEKGLAGEKKKSNKTLTS